MISHKMIYKADLLGDIQIRILDQNQLHLTLIMNNMLKIYMKKIIKSQVRFCKKLYKKLKMISILKLLREEVQAMKCNLHLYEINLILLQIEKVVKIIIILEHHLKI